MEKEEREKTAKILSNIFQKLNVNAKVEIAKDKADGLNLIVDNFTSFDISGDTFRHIIEKFSDIYNEYDSDERIVEWKKQNAGKSTPAKESEIRERYENIGYELSIIGYLTNMLYQYKTVDDWEMLDPDIKEKELTEPKNFIKTFKITNAINHILDDLNIEAWVNRVPYMIILYISTDYNYDSSYEFDEFEPTSLIEVANEIKNTAENYDWEEERSLWTPGKNGALEEPYLTEEFKNIGHIMEDIRWAMEALLEIEKSQDKSYENKERIIKKYKRIIHKQKIETFRRKIHIAINGLGSLGLSNDEILNVVKEEMNNLV